MKDPDPVSSPDPQTPSYTLNYEEAVYLRLSDMRS